MKPSVIQGRRPICLPACLSAVFACLEAAPPLVSEWLPAVTLFLIEAELVSLIIAVGQGSVFPGGLCRQLLRITDRTHTLGLRQGNPAARELSPPV